MVLAGLESLLSFLPVSGGMNPMTWQTGVLVEQTICGHEPLGGLGGSEPLDPPPCCFGNESWVNLQLILAQFPTIHTRHLQAGGSARAQAPTEGEAQTARGAMGGDQARAGAFVYVSAAELCRPAGTSARSDMGWNRIAR
jgi:hypothetical protein